MTKAVKRVFGGHGFTERVIVKGKAAANGGVSGDRLRRSEVSDYYLLHEQQFLISPGDNL